MSRVDVDGVGIEYEVTGEGRPVVLLHGFPDSGRLWRHQVPALAGLHAAAAHDASLAGAFIRVAGLVARTESLLRPASPCACCGQPRTWRRAPGTFAGPSPPADKEPVMNRLSR